MNEEAKRQKRIKKVLKVTMWTLVVAIVCCGLSTCMSLVLDRYEEELQSEGLFVLLVGTVVPTPDRSGGTDQEPPVAEEPLTSTPVLTGTPAISTPLPPIWTAIPEPTLTMIPAAAVTHVEAMVVEVVDGDTIKVEMNGVVYTVRYIGIDTPETVHPSKPIEWMGAEASAANEALVGGQGVFLEKDVSETDRYGRLLRYVYLDDGTFVNAKLVRLGYAQVSTYPPDVCYQELFLQMQQEAMGEGLGLWSTPPTAVSAEPPPAVVVCNCSGNIYNCKRDFVTRTQAQECHDYCMQVTGRDIHELDGDDDGQACESLP